MTTYTMTPLIEYIKPLKNHFVFNKTVSIILEVCGKNIATHDQILELVKENAVDIPRIPQLLVFLLRIKKYTELSNELAIKAAIDIECACYSHIHAKYCGDTNITDRDWGAPEFIHSYSDLCGDICMIMSGKCQIKESYGENYTNFIETIKNMISADSSKEDADEIISKGIENYFPESFRKEAEDIEEKKHIKAEQKVSNLYKCPKCKGNECTWTATQTRALDEEVTIIATCTNPVCRMKFIAS